MDKQLILIFQMEVRFQCKVLLAGAADLDRAMAHLSAVSRAGTSTMDAVDEVWMALQQLLIGAANISKLLWGPGGKKEAERADLRSSIGVDNSSALRDPDMRNDWEHIDQRVEAWWDTDSRHIFFGRIIGPFDAITGDDSQRRFGQFNPATGEVIFWQHSVSVPAVVQEARAMLAHLDPVTLATPWMRPGP